MTFTEIKCTWYRLYFTGSCMSFFVRDIAVCGIYVPGLIHCSVIPHFPCYLYQQLHILQELSHKKTNYQSSEKSTVLNLIKSRGNFYYISNTYCKIMHKATESNVS